MFSVEKHNEIAAVKEALVVIEHLRHITALGDPLESSNTPLCLYYLQVEHTWEKSYNILEHYISP